MPFATNGIAPPAFSCKNIIAYIRFEIMLKARAVTLENRVSINGDCSFATSPQGFHLTGYPGGASHSPTENRLVPTLSVIRSMRIVGLVFVARCYN